MTVQKFAFFAAQDGSKKNHGPRALRLALGISSLVPSWKRVTANRRSGRHQMGHYLLETLLRVMIMSAFCTEATSLDPTHPQLQQEEGLSVGENSVLVPAVQETRSDWRGHGNTKPTLRGARGHDTRRDQNAAQPRLTMRVKTLKMEFKNIGVRNMGVGLTPGQRCPLNDEITPFKSQNTTKI